VSFFYAVIFLIPAVVTPVILRCVAILSSALHGLNKMRSLNAETADDIYSTDEVLATQGTMP
jgi:hypothetical protein